MPTARGIRIRGWPRGKGRCCWEAEGGGREEGELTSLDSEQASVGSCLFVQMIASLSLLPTLVLHGKSACIVQNIYREDSGGWDHMSDRTET